MVEADNISKASPLHTMTTAQITVSSAGDMEDSQGGTANILAADMESSNGIVHAISGVMLPFPEEYLGVSGDGEDTSDDDDDKGRNVEVAAITAGVCAAVILVLAAFAVQKRRQAEAARPPQVAPDEAGWVGAGRPAPIHPA